MKKQSVNEEQYHLKPTVGIAISKKEKGEKPKNECADEKDFKPHMMYDPKTGKGYMAKTYDDHVRMDKDGLLARNLKSKRIVQDVMQCVECLETKTLWIRMMTIWLQHPMTVKQPIRIH